MPRRQNPVPTYRLHRQSGQAIVTLRLSDGSRRDILLGKYGNPESKTEYERVLAEVRAAPAAFPTLPSGRPAPAVTVNEVLLAFARYSDKHYRGPAGELTREVTEYRQAIKLVRGLYGLTPANEFGLLALKAVRQQMIDAGLCRAVVNRRVGRVKRMFKWAASEELVPPTSAPPWRPWPGCSGAGPGVRDTDPVEPVAEAAVRAVLPHVRPEVAAMISVQQMTGMRPGEVCRLRPCDVDTAGGVWLYRPKQHKSGWRGCPGWSPSGRRPRPC